MVALWFLLLCIERRLKSWARITFQHSNSLQTLTPVIWFNLSYQSITLVAHHIKHTLLHMNTPIGFHKKGEKWVLRITWRSCDSWAVQQWTHLHFNEKKNCYRIRKRSRLCKVRPTYGLRWDSKACLTGAVPNDHRCPLVINPLYVLLKQTMPVLT